MKKKIYALLLTGTILLSMVACGTTNDVTAGANTPAPTKEAVPTAEPTKAPTEAPAPVAKTVSPLPVTIDMNNLTNCTLSVSFNPGDAYVDDTGVMQLKVKVYTYDLYDMVDISTLTEGDTIILGGEEIVVTSLNQTSYGSIEINGSLDMGGYELRTNDNTVYYQTSFSDAKFFYELGEATLRVSADFLFTDKSDLDKGAVTYYPGDLLTNDGVFFYSFVPDNTTIVIQDNQVIAMERVYIP